MQHGSLIKNIRKHGSGVWQFRWSEKSPQGKRIYRKRVIGSVGDYSDVDAARRALPRDQLRRDATEKLFDDDRPTLRTLCSA